MRTRRAKISVVTTVLALGGLSAVALSAQPGPMPPDDGKQASAEIRTQVVNRTVLQRQPGVQAAVFGAAAPVARAAPSYYRAAYRPAAATVPARPWRRAATPVRRRVATARRSPSAAPNAAPPVPAASPAPAQEAPAQSSAPSVTAPAPEPVRTRASGEPTEAEKKAAEATKQAAEKAAELAKKEAATGD